MRMPATRVRRPARGFSLVELAVVMAIVGLMLGGLMYTLSAQTEQRSFEETRRRLEQARELVLAFAIVKGRLPCPARYTSSASHSLGMESFCTAAATSSTSTCAGSETTTEQAHGTCSNHFDGYLPAASIGYTQTDASGFAVDSWGNRIRYAVTRTNTNCSGTVVPPNGYTTMYTGRTYLQNYGISCQPNDLIVCKSATAPLAPAVNPGASPPSCGANGANQHMSSGLVVAIAFSTGKNGGTADATRVDEAANIKAAASGLTPTINAIFVSHTPTPRDASGGEFDDQLSWITVGELYGRLIAAGILP